MAPSEMTAERALAIPCMPLVTQLRTHSGYELRSQDRHDLKLLATLS